MIDHPFVIWDLIVVDDIMGTVERVGLKTTRERSLTGELVFVNSDLFSTRLRNLQDRQERRIVLSVISGDDTFRLGPFHVVRQFLP